ncbi:cell division protein ZapA [Clostridium sp. MSJ-4]|uniref:Cell division protein ZapA n=1 Tax=Clostridium simiarum TaxID=2841506 RepID=A0ABS6EWN9_9CLOT|nr:MULTISPECIES: cell division protein ZapA [Clostridium]MBU5590637.1 cell division protein ZapA [Clostridium simiarum]
MNVITVKINGIDYNLKGDESEEYLHKIANCVDKKLKSIMDNNKKLSVSSASILTSMNVVDDLFKSETKLISLTEKIERLENTEIDLKEQLEVLKKQLVHMENYNNELQSKINSIESQKNNSGELKDELDKLKGQNKHLEENAKIYLKENQELKAFNKELKFQLQSSKYKLIDMQHRLLENQIDLVKIKKERNPLVADKVK